MLGIWYLVSAYGGTYYGNSGQITSPRYPQRYPNNGDYTWVIVVSSGMQVRLTFASIAVESSSAATCPYDYVRVSVLFL